MKIKANKKYRNIDFRYIADLKSYAGLSKEELDVAVNGILFRGHRFPLCYVFWGDKRKCRKVRISLTGEVGTLIGENIIILPKAEHSVHRGIVLLPDDRITDLSYSVLQFV